MQLTGSLGEFSWPDLLDLIAHKRLSGWLCIEASDENTQARQPYQVWFQKGCLVSATQSSRRTNGLFWLMQHQGWLGYNSALKIAQHCPGETAVGRYFRQQGALDNQQLKQLFHLQLKPVLKGLSQLQAGQFQLDTTLPLPYEQMTGLKMLAYDAHSMARQVAVSP
jgi:hypothetical protein